jgi:putative spermidine/putrescine transport system permease protein
LPGRRAAAIIGDDGDRPEPDDTPMSRQAELAAVAPAVRRQRRISWAWLGIGPFFLFSLLFLILPTLDLVIGAFQTPDGGFTLDNIARLNQPTILSAYWISIQVSLASSPPSAVSPRTSPASRSLSPSSPRWGRPGW